MAQLLAKSIATSSKYADPEDIFLNCNDPGERHRFLIGVLRDPASRGGSLAVHAWREGDVVRVSAPKNHFSMVPARASPQVAAALAHPGPGTHLYVCGPAGFIEHILGTAKALGWHPDDVHAEYFAAQAADPAGAVCWRII